MSAPVEPVPTLELPSDRLMQWSQMALLLAAQLAQRREQLDRLAWSDAEHAARAHDLAELRDMIEPAVRSMTAEEIAQMRPLSEVDPELHAAFLHRRGPQIAPTKERISLRLDRDVLQALQAGGRGWQGRANAALRKAVLGE